jgi:uncharacterized tellurite resistance protein B-like protein
VERTVKDLLGGGIRPGDPRRFLIEAMVGAMNADGVTDPREVATMHKLVAEHPLFKGLGPAAARTLVELSTDAIRFAGSSIARTSAIAKGLPARIHRIAAFGMATEVVAADERVALGELEFLEALRLALRISPLEADGIVQAARTGELAAFLDDRYLRVKSLVSVVADVFALRALALATITDDHRFKVRDLFAGIADLALSRDELDIALYRAFRRPRDAQVSAELARIASLLPDPVDRYWMVVYALIAEPPHALASWRVIPFVGVMQAAFQITDTDMELAVIDALTFPASLVRPR